MHCYNASFLTYYFLICKYFNQISANSDIFDDFVLAIEDYQEMCRYYDT